MRHLTGARHLVKNAETKPSLWLLRDWSTQHGNKLTRDKGCLRRAESGSRGLHKGGSVAMRPGRKGEADLCFSDR